MADPHVPRRNRLANETSPYLLQHADNPVDWYPWGPEAFAAAGILDRPILLSVGYSSCHWCHVMAHESFEDPRTAGLMNDWFVNVKVDREERPDVDGVYMTAVQALTGQGGWPMTVFMTPDGKPFYAGTYFPPRDGHGRPGFPRLLQALHEAWVGDREKLLGSAEDIAAQLRTASERVPEGAAPPVTRELLKAAVTSYVRAFDPVSGGFGGAPKFPAPSNLEFLLACHTAGIDGPEPGAREVVLHTLRQMAAGGMYDQLGGGFARYSVDATWLVPHFEKMLYDNAQLARVYLHAWQVTGDAFFARVARETLDFMAAEMRDPDGGFWSAYDADSEGIEGKYYVFTVDETAALLGGDAPFFNFCFGVTADGNFTDPHHPELTGRTVLSRRAEIAEIVRAFGLDAAEVEARLANVRARMLAARRLRVPPGLDDKVLTSWTGLALAAFAEGARVFDDAGYRAIAGECAAFLRERAWRDGRLLHTYKAGVAKIDGMLEDYAYVALGLVELFKLTGGLEELAWARELLHVILTRFADGERGGFFETADDGERLLLRQKELFDQATPSGNGAAALAALWLARYDGRPQTEAIAERTLAQAHDHLLAAVTGFGTLWQVAAFFLAPPRELVIAGPPDGRAPLERVAAARYDPWLVLIPSGGGGGLPVLEGREDASTPRAFLCENMACRMPVTTAEELAAQFDERAVQ